MASRLVGRASLVIVTALFAAAAALAGPLNPPAGPIGPTPGPEPRVAINATNTPGDAAALFRITQPGSYYLAADIIGVSGKNGIAIANSNGVTIDLMGYRLQGVAGSQSAIATVGLQGNITIRNGTIGGWGGDGIDLTIGGVGEIATLENLHVMYNGGQGIDAPIQSTVRNCVVTGNQANGIVTREDSLVTGCTSRGNGQSGIAVGRGSAVESCVADANADGIRVFAGSGRVVDCSASDNNGHGFFVIATHVVSCAASDNGGAGFQIGSESSITNSFANNNDHAGISGALRALVESCSVYSNGEDGIEVGDRCVVRNNVACENGSKSSVGAGVHAQGSHNRIEGNHCSSAGRGILVDGSINVIIRNTCSQNTVNWSLGANNAIGPIINRLGVVSPVIGGDSYAGSLGSTDPNANFTH